MTQEHLWIGQAMDHQKKTKLLNILETWKGTGNAAVVRAWKQKIKLDFLTIFNNPLSKYLIYKSFLNALALFGAVYLN